MKIENEKNGFTIVELMIVLSVIGILAAVTAPSIRIFLLNSNTKKISMGVHDTLQKAKMLAISEGVNIKVTFSDPDNQVGHFSAVNIVTPAVGLLPEKVISTYPISYPQTTSRGADDDTEIVFSSRGTVLNDNPGSWSIINDKTGRGYTINVNLIGAIDIDVIAPPNS